MSEIRKKTTKYEVKEKLPVSLKLKESIELLCRERERVNERVF